MGGKTTDITAVMRRTIHNVNQSLHAITGLTELTRLTLKHQESPDNLPQTMEAIANAIANIHDHLICAQTYLDVTDEEALRQQQGALHIHSIPGAGAKIAMPHPLHVVYPTGQRHSPAPARNPNTPVRTVPKQRKRATEDGLVATRRLDCTLPDFVGEPALSRSAGGG